MATQWLLLIGALLVGAAPVSSRSGPSRLLRPALSMPSDARARLRFLPAGAGYEPVAPIPQRRPPVMSQPRRWATPAWLPALGGAVAAWLCWGRWLVGVGFPVSTTIAAMATTKIVRVKRPNPMKDTKVVFNLSGPSLGKVGGSGMPKLCRAIKRNLPEGTALSVLFLPEEGARPLAEALRENETITKLDLTGNAGGMGDRGCVLFWDCLPINSTLKILMLINNDIGDQGMEFLAEGLRLNRSVHTIFLHQNRIGDVGATALADALKTNTTLTGVYLQRNAITDRGAAALAAALKVNAAVTVLDLSRNLVENPRILLSIKESCQRNQEGRPLPELPPERFPRRAIPPAVVPVGPVAPAVGGYHYDRTPMYVEDAARAEETDEDEEEEGEANVVGPVGPPAIVGFQRVSRSDYEAGDGLVTPAAPSDAGADPTVAPTSPPDVALDGSGGPPRGLPEADDTVPLTGTL